MVNKMPDYTFYRDVYLGSAIDEKRFPQLAARAAEALEKMKRTYRVEGGEQAQAMAICTMAECLLAEKMLGVRSATVGSVSIQYEKFEKAIAAAMYDAAGIFLDIYRGVQDA